MYVLNRAMSSGSIERRFSEILAWIFHTVSSHMHLVSFRERERKKQMKPVDTALFVAQCLTSLTGMYVAICLEDFDQ